MNKNLKILFTLSVILNVLLLGVSGGMIARRHHGPQAWMEPPRGLSPEARALMAQEFQEAHKQIGPLGDEAREARENVVKVLSSPEFSEREFDAAIDDLREAQQGIMTQKMNATKKIASQLPQEERVKLADHFAKSYRKWNKDGGKHDFPPPPGGQPPAKPAE